MSIHQINTTLEFCWAVPVNSSPPAKSDFDIRLTYPNESAFYIDDAILTYTAPTATAQGIVTYKMTPDKVGRYIIELMIGGSLAHVLQSKRQIYVVDVPSYVLSGFTHNPYQGPEVLPPAAP